MNAVELKKIVIENDLCGIDRIVPVAKIVDFGLVWDGYDLFTSMRRLVFTN